MSRCPDCDAEIMPHENGCVFCAVQRLSAASATDNQAPDPDRVESAARKAGLDDSMVGIMRGWAEKQAPTGIARGRRESIEDVCMAWLNAPTPHLVAELEDWHESALVAHGKRQYDKGAMTAYAHAKRLQAMDAKDNPGEVE